MIAIAINVRHESPRQLAECFGRVRANMPDAKVCVFMDGVDRPELDDLADGFKVVQGEHLGRNETSPLWWKRQLRWFLGTGARYMIQLDPDAMIDRPPRFFPDEHYFGTVEHEYVQGGLETVSAVAAKALMSGILDEPFYYDVANYTTGGIGKTAYCDDHMIGHALRRLGFHAANWTECFSRWKTPVENADLAYALVHPRYYP